MPEHHSRIRDLEVFVHESHPRNLLDAEGLQMRGHTSSLVQDAGFDERFNQGLQSVVSFECRTEAEMHTPS